jgi:hypothetical protein
MEHLGPLRFHPLAQPGGQNHGGGRHLRRLSIRTGVTIRKIVNLYFLMPFG